MNTISLPTTEKIADRAKSKRTLRGRVGRSALVLAILVLALAVSGVLYQAIGGMLDTRRFPAPGQLYDVGGYKLHLYCTGPENTGSPTVVLETLSGGASPYWAWVQPEIAQTTRVCSYDRAGRAWSQPATRPLSLKQTVDDLHTLLERAGVRPPYVIVGHSIGGLYVRRFAADFPGTVAGMVLVDAAHPEQFQRFPQLFAENAAYDQQSAMFPLLARLGIFRLYFASGGEIDFQDLPAREHAIVASLWSSPEYFESQRAENNAAPGIYTDAHALGALGNLPLAVVTRGTGTENGWAELQNELAALSTDSIHVTIPNSTHSSLAFNRQHAQGVSAAILRVVNAVKLRHPLKP